MKLVDNAKSAWRWFSVQAMFVAGAITLAWNAMPADLQARVPDHLVDAMTVAILVLGIAGRLVKQGSSE